jgi:hypothetical protein
MHILLCHFPVQSEFHIILLNLTDSISLINFLSTGIEFFLIVENEMLFREN